MRWRSSVPRYDPLYPTPPPILTSCTALESLIPPSSLVGEVTNITVRGTFPGVSSLNLFCNFEGYGPVPANSATNETVECQIPSGMAAGNVPVSIYSNTTQFTNAIDFVVYGTAPD